MLKLAKENGLVIPIVYNTSSYEKVSSLKLLDGLIDIYLPDLKYYDDWYSIKYSKAPNYFNIAIDAIEEMYRQVGNVVYDKNGNYFRIEDTTRPRGRNYLDIDGNDMNNEVVNGKTRGRSRADYQRVTHFNNSDK